MQNRLVAENVLKAPFKGQPYFSINKKLLSYSVQQALKLKSFNKQCKDLQIKMENNKLIKFFQLSYYNSWAYIVTKDDILQVYLINQQQKISKVLTIKGVLGVKQACDSLILDCNDSYYRVLSFEMIRNYISTNNKQIQLQKLYSFTKKQVQDQIVCSAQNKSIFIKSKFNKDQTLLTQFSLKKSNKYQKCLQIDYVKHPIAFYRDKYIMGLSNDNDKKVNKVQFFDIYQQKIIGKVQFEGQFKYSKIRENLFTIIFSHQNNDYYAFYLLNPRPDNKSDLITHKITYQRGKGDFYDFVNLKTAESLNFIDKKKQQTLNDLYPEQIDNTTSSIIYVLNKQKSKIQIIKLDHSKVCQSPFVLEKQQKKVVSNIVKNKIQQEKRNQAEQVERTRIKSSLEHKSQNRSLQDTQRRFVQAIVDNKIKHMMSKFQQLQKRVERLQKSIKYICQKIDQNLKNVNREEIRSSVQSLFQQLTPQFEKYFSQLFKQVSGVLDQGVSFYNKKLASQAEIHKQALNQIVTKTFQQTTKIVQLSKKQEKLSQRTQKHLNDLLESRNKWQKKTQELQNYSRQRDINVTNTKVSREPGQGKVFVRADLNVSSRRQT